MRRNITVAGLLLALVAPDLARAAPPPNPISIVAATYQEASGKRVIDVADKLQDLCGAHARLCQFYCAASTFGDNKLHHRKICRVIYRCGEESTRVAQGEENDPVTLRCQTPAHDD